MIENKARFCSRIGDARTCLGSCLFCGTDVAVPGEFVINVNVEIVTISVFIGGSTTGMFSHLSVHHKEAYREAKESQHQPTPSFKPTKPPSASPIDLSARLLSPYIPLYHQQAAAHLSQYQHPKIVSVKPLEPRHVQLSVFPYLYHSYVKVCVISSSHHCIVCNLTVLR